MAEPSFDDIDSLGKEIDRLWAKVATSSVHEYDAPPSAPAAPEGPSKQLAWDTINMLKRQHRQQSNFLQDTIELKEKAIHTLRERLTLLENENAALKDQVKADESIVIEEGLKVHAQLEAGMATFEAEKRQRDDEQRALRALLEQTRQRLAVEDARWKAEQRQWEKKEQQYLLDLREMQGTAARLQQEGGQSSDEGRRLSGSLKEAKNALEKTLSELLRERQVREQSEQEREKAVKKVDEVEKHLNEMSRLWDEERAQWRELWDRERSTWETQRQEFSTWEERLRKEREAWHAELESKEKDQLRFTEEMTRSLRDTAELSTKVSAVLRGQRPSTLARLSGRARAMILAAVVLAAAGPAVWRYAHRHHFKSTLTHAVALETPTALGYDGSLLWLASWDGRMQGFEPQNLNAAVRETSRPTDLGSYRPVSMAFGGEYLWSLDAAQGRVMRHRASNPQGVILTRATPGPAPTALAFDGANLWSYDASNRTVYKHGSDEGSSRAFALNPELVVTAMAWVGESLWVYDSKTRCLVDFKFADDAFKESQRYPFDGTVIGIATASEFVDGKKRPQLWVLVGPSGQRTTAALVKYAY